MSAPACACSLHVDKLTCPMVYPSSLLSPTPLHISVTLASKDKTLSLSLRDQQSRFSVTLLGHWDFQELLTDDSSGSSVYSSTQSRAAWYLDCAAVLGRNLHDLSYLCPERSASGVMLPLPMAIINRLTTLVDAQQ
jgi:hypothetical protein